MGKVIEKVADGLHAWAVSRGTDIGEEAANSPLLRRHPPAPDLPRNVAAGQGKQDKKNPGADYQPASI